MSRVLQEMLNVDEFKCNPFASRIVELFSEDGSGVISFQKFINIFSVFSPRATAETKTVWAFAVWDFDGTSCTHSMPLHRSFANMQRVHHIGCSPLVVAGSARVQELLGGPQENLS